MPSKLPMYDAFRKAAMRDFELRMKELDNLADKEWREAIEEEKKKR